MWIGFQISAHANLTSSGRFPHRNKTYSSLIDLECCTFAAQASVAVTAVLARLCISLVSRCFPALPTKLVAGSILPTVIVPVVKWRGFPAIPDPVNTLTRWAGAAPSISAPSVGSRPTDPDGRTRAGTTEGITTHSVPAAQGANRTWFGDRRLKTRSAGFSPGRCSRSPSDLESRCYVPNAGLSGVRSSG